MVKNIKLYTLGILVFLLLLSLSGVEGLIGALCYPLAFILPTAGLLLITKKDGLPPLTPRAHPSLLLPLTAPAILLIFGTAYLTALVIFHTLGAENEVTVTGNLLTDIFTLAIAPAVLEEMLFRYLPLRLIAPYSKKTALVISSLFFALAHCSLFSIPHALIAGAVFMTADLLSGSVIPSVILHLLNNLVSVGWEYAYPTGYAHLIPIALLALSLLCVPFIIMKKEDFAKAARKIFSRDDRTSLPKYTLALAIPTLGAAILELIGK